MNNFLEYFVVDDIFIVNEKIIELVVYSVNDYICRKMVYCSWLEKILFVLIEEVCNFNNVVVFNIVKIIK